MRKTLLTFLSILMAAAAYAGDSQTLTLEGSKGKLHAELQRPTVSDGKTPLVILCHGFGGNGGGPLFEGIADALQEEGVASLRFDFNGHGQSEGEFQDMTVPNEIEDLKRVIEWAKAQPWVGDISLMGHSQGGVVAGMTAGELGDKEIKSLVLMAPAAVLRDDALRGNTMGAMYDPWNMTEDYVSLWGGHLKLGKEYIRSALTLPIYETSLQYEGPVLIIHGTHDRVVPYTYAERYDQGYKDSRLQLLDGDDHGLGKYLQQTIRQAADWVK